MVGALEAKRVARRGEVPVVTARSGELEEGDGYAGRPVWVAEKRGGAGQRPGPAGVGAMGRGDEGVAVAGGRVHQITSVECVGDLREDGDGAGAAAHDIGRGGV